MGVLSRVELDALVEEATVDAYDDDEQLTGLYSMLEEHLAVPFTTRVLSVEVTVRLPVDLARGSDFDPSSATWNTPRSPSRPRTSTAVDLRHGVAVAICHRDPIRQAIGILDLPLPEPPPPGAEWIEAYRRWSKGINGE